MHTPLMIRIYKGAGAPDNVSMDRYLQRRLPWVREAALRLLNAAARRAVIIGLAAAMPSGLR